MGRFPHPLKVVVRTLFVDDEVQRFAAVVAELTAESRLVVGDVERDAVTRRAGCTCRMTHNNKHMQRHSDAAGRAHLPHDTQSNKHNQRHSDATYRAHLPHDTQQ